MAFLGCLLILSLGITFTRAQFCRAPDDFIGASSPGDITIGGLFAVHGKMMYSGSGYPQRPAIQHCAGFEMQGFLQSLSMIHAIESINNSTLLPGITLGYEIYDTCSEVTVALAAAMRFLSKFNTSENLVEFRCNYTDYIPRVKAVIGASFSEQSVAVSRMLNLQLIPLVSYSASAEILSDKIRFPSFLRTIPNDSYQTRAMAKLIHEFDWNWIGMIATDDDYGRLALENFGIQAMIFNVCIAFKEILPSHLSDNTINNKINQVLNIITRESRVNVIVVFLKPYLIINLFNKAIERRIQRTWIASDSWSAASRISSIPNIKNIGKVIGFTFKSGNVSAFQNFLKNLGQKQFMNNKLLNQYAALLSDCSDMKDNDLNQCISNYSKGSWTYKPSQGNQTLKENFLSDLVQPGFVYSTRLAVTAIAYAIGDLCKDRNCKDPSAFAPWELLQALKNVTFTDGSKKIHFNSRGDINIGYNVLIWKETQTGKMNITTVAEYNLQSGNFVFKDKKEESEFYDLKKIMSKCSDECQPGQMKKTSTSQHTCCYECVTCPENHYTNESDMGYCLLCNNKTHWSPINSSTCFTKATDYFDWDDGLAIVLVILSAVGIVLIITTGIIFTKHLNTPVVKASGGVLCHIILLCLFFSFVSTGFFVGKPQDFKCKARQTVFGISFTFCVSCILLKSLKILLAFSFDPQLQHFLKCLYKPFTVVFTCTGIQVMICAFWLLFKAPHVVENFSIPQTIILECAEGSMVAFGIMLGYIAVLAFVCFVFAFKGRKLPENYNEAKFITFGMLIYFIVWITFIPVYATTFGKFLPAVEVIVILISNYGILICTFFPKCYIILYKQESNTKSAFLKMVYNYSSKSVSSLAVSQASIEYRTDPRFSVTDSCYKCSINCISTSSYYFQKPELRFVSFQRAPINLAGSLPRKRTSSI
ncbi:G-protein coupled receptor family C group 6 member A-like [Rhinatrema bivittatum]|uniref:G-protein coupled receptor family C group 6 member A-like n=1 Tax=Rhinatrema bivittatum TaxID=194408 RepID=UPI00112E7509|nr:G-protein coupled receptor family C group 6 member A-like [Rhinatrema bivittatum]